MNAAEFLGAAAGEGGSWRFEIGQELHGAFGGAFGGVVRPMGRPSTISACGHDGESVLSVATLPRANCLTVWWFPD